MKRKWTALLGIFTMLVVSIGIFLISNQAFRWRHLKHEYGPNQLGGTVAATPTRIETTPVLQRGVKPEQVTSEFELETSPEIPAYSQTKLEAKTGDVISVRFANKSDPKFHYRHNFVLVKPGKENAVMRDGERVGSENSFVPPTDDVLAASHLLDPGESDTVLFRAPEQPGEYPFICTFPGHGNVMRGILRIH